MCDFKAAAALGKIGDRKAIKDLQSVLKTDNAYVKIAAEEALEKFPKIITGGIQFVHEKTG